MNSTSLESTVKTDYGATVVRNAITSWETYTGRANQIMEKATDEMLLKPIAVGRNSGAYLLGHLLAVHDNMVPVLGLGERKYAHYDEPFLKNRDGAEVTRPEISMIREDWNELHVRIAALIKTISVDEWFGRHTLVSEEDFAKEPHRNKLAVLQGRTLHLTYHLGQIALTEGV